MQQQMQQQMQPQQQPQVRPMMQHQRRSRFWMKNLINYYFNDVK
jgi:hypothetical protein